MHAYICEADACHRSSRVSYRLLGRAQRMTLTEFRRYQDDVVKALEARLPPGGKITIPEIVEDQMGPAQVLTAQRQTAVPGRPTEFSTSTHLIGPKQAVSVISSSLDAAANKSNYSMYMLPIVMFMTAGAAPRQ